MSLLDYIRQFTRGQEYFKTGAMPLTINDWMPQVKNLPLTAKAKPIPTNLCPASMEYFVNVSTSGFLDLPDIVLWQIFSWFNGAG